MSNLTLAFLLSLLAGLSTGIGSLITMFAKKTNTNFLATSLGFSAGVMVYVSLVELLRQAQDLLAAALGGKTGEIAAVAAFFAGMLLAAAIDKILPDETNPHEVRHYEPKKILVINRKRRGEYHGDQQSIERHVHEHHQHGHFHNDHHHGEHRHDEKKRPERNRRNLMRTGIITAAAITIHNFPEGMATFISVLYDPAVALPIVLAIALHNIPEGISVSVPIYYATGSKKKALLYSFASGLAEPVGAVVGFFILMPYLNEIIYGVLFAIIAGIMVFISFDELLPTAREYGEHHLSIYGMVAGMLIMAVSLILL